MDILKRPMFFAAVACGTIATISLFAPIMAIVVSIVIIAVLIFVNVQKHCRYIAVLVFVILFTIAILFELAKIERIRINDGKKISGTFLVCEETVDHGEYITAVLKSKNCDLLPNNTRLLAFDYKKTELKPGDIVDVTINLNIVGRYDKYRLSNYGDSIYATANIQNIKTTENKSYLYNALGRVRYFAKHTIFNLYDDDVSGLLLAITTGDKSLLSEKFLDNVKTTGISHVIVVSGMHLAIIMYAIYFCSDRIFYNKYLRCIISIIFVLIIYSICGFTMSITRAGTMFVVASVAPIFNRENDSLNSILTAITFVLIASPFAIINASFLLSVLSTLSIAWVVPFYYRIIIDRFNLSSKFLKSIIASTLCSFFAIIFTLPVTIRLFGYVSIVAPLTNLIINLPITVALIFNIVTILISSIPYINFLSFPFAFVTGACSKITVFVVNAIAKLPITVAVLPKSSFFWSIVLIFAVIAYMYYYEFKKKEVIFNANNIRRRIKT